MPVYRYRCPAGHELEDIEGFDAPAWRDCLKCPAEQPVTECACDEPCDCDYDEFPRPVQMERVPPTGVGVLWRGGPHTRKFSR